ncbi:MAG: hypothetical protein H0X68_02110 [Chloroflexi bacterium]|nr:hypothetical protein [Chloroflexota bacterium]
MGEPPMATGAEAAVRRHRLRIRTVVVSFTAAVRSAHRDLEVGAAERDALIELWRAWAISMLDDYALNAKPLMDAAGLNDAERKALEDEMQRGYQMVRDA